MIMQTYGAVDEDGNHVTVYAPHADQNEPTSNVHIITSEDGCSLTWAEAQDVAEWILRHAPKGETSEQQ